MSFEAEKIETSKEEISEREEIKKISIDDIHYLSIQKTSPSLKFLELLIKDPKNRVILNISKDITPMAIKFMVDNEGGFGADSKDRVVHVPVQRFSDPKDIFYLLHEIGHIIVRQTELEEQPSRAEVKAVARSIIEFSREDPNVLSVVLQDEREAWTMAIKKAKELKREHDLDLFALFPTKNDFMSWFRTTGLRTYEHALERINVASYSRDKKTREWFNKHKDELPSRFKEIFKGRIKMALDSMLEKIVKDLSA